MFIILIMKCFVLIIALVLILPVFCLKVDDETFENELKSFTKSRMILWFLYLSNICYYCLEIIYKYFIILFDRFKVISQIINIFNLQPMRKRYWLIKRDQDAYSIQLEFIVPLIDMHVMVEFIVESCVFCVALYKFVWNMGLEKNEFNNYLDLFYLSIYSIYSEFSCWIKSN